LRQSSSAGARIDLSSVRFECGMTKISKCALCRLMKPVLMPTSVYLAFQFRFLLAVPVCLYLSQIVCRCTSQHFVLDSNGLRHQKILVAADGTQIAFPT
ncbi:hypothetical protein T08_15710, partial [Trichinella sp. T8]